jgi:hypothetical protein
MEELKKYRVVTWPAVCVDNREPLRLFEDRLNNLAEFGYEVLTVRDEFVVMQLKEPGANDYSNVTNLKDVPPNEVDTHIADGWEITSTSISTKFVRMVKRK